MHLTKPLFYITAIVVLLISCGDAPESGKETPPEPETQTTDVASSNEPLATPLPNDPLPNDYGDPQNWLCHPLNNAACEIDLDATRVDADGTLTVEPHVVATDPKFDCFYLYPTASLDPGVNSDMIPGSEERFFVESQFARFGNKCRLFAPMYRQRTLTALIARLNGQDVDGDHELAYGDVRDAWVHYLTHENQGRGVILIGHSQGASTLKLLLKREIEGTSAQDQLIAAYLAGTAVAVPKGKNVGDYFEEIPLCTSETATGCIVTYASYRSEIPPDETAQFGKPWEPTENNMAGCTNPASLGGGRAALKPYMKAHPYEEFAIKFDPGDWIQGGANISTPYVTLPGLISGECLTNPHSNYLDVTTHSDPNDPRTDSIIGDMVAPSGPMNDWGLHAVDLDLAMGNLIELAEKQAAAWDGARE